MSLVYWLSKFSQEAIVIELFLISCLTMCYFGYLLTRKRKYGAARQNIPDTVVKEFLAELMASAEGFKNQLFGEAFKLTAARAPRVSAEGPMMAAPAAGAADTAELGALRSQLAGTQAKLREFEGMIATLTAAKSQLEAKVASGAPAPDGSSPAAALQEKITKLESKLAEYEVIEDDLANLKKYQQENKQLRAQLEALQKGAPLPPAAATPAAPSPIAAAEETVSAKKAVEGFDGLADKVEESLAPPAGASASDPLAQAAAKTAPPVMEPPKAAPAPPAAPAAAPPAPAPAAPAAAGSKEERSDADLLSEFERMLNS